MTKENDTNPALAGLTQEEIIELRKQERAGAFKRAREFATRFVSGHQ